MAKMQQKKTAQTTHKEWLIDKLSNNSIQFTNQTSNLEYTLNIMNCNYLSDKSSIDASGIGL